MPITHRSGEGVYGAGVSLSLPLLSPIYHCHSLSLHFPPYLTHWLERRGAWPLLLTLVVSETQHWHQESPSTWPTTIFVPCSHRTEVRQEVRVEGRAVRGGPPSCEACVTKKMLEGTGPGHTSRHTIKAQVRLFD